ncbi:MAG TPA: hypothetical protein DDW49_06140 [Deltaproteobacteria bacterium]|nr:hypothetical protein [Deltaproteobacteria bacterium]
MNQSAIALKKVYPTFNTEFLTFFKKIEISTAQNNLLELEPKLGEHVTDFDFFHINDLTENLFDWIEESGVQEGSITVQSLHTTCVVAVNELDEPCLLGDINKFMRESIPRTKPYLHNSSIRTKNLCESDTKCDRNADSHMKSFLFGNHSQSIIVHEGKPVLGEWQRLCFIDLDGPRTRNIAISVVGV